MHPKQERWLYFILSNTALLYGVIGLGWPLFPVVYLWWWEGLLYLFINYFYQKEPLLIIIPQLLMYAIYLFFIVGCVGVLAAEGNDLAINQQVLFLKHPLFGLSLLLLILHLGFQLLRKTYDPNLVAMLHTRMHVMIIVGALLMFTATNWGWTGKMGMIVGILIVKAIADAWVLKQAT